jgi:hypothetical protein
VSTIRDFDGLEIWPCCVVGFSDDQPITEICEPDQAEFWTVHGHRREGGITALQDFESSEAARSFADRLLDTYPHLRHHGLSDNS